MEAKDCEPPKSSNESEVLDSNVETKSVQQSDSNDASNDRQQTKASEPTENGELAANVDKQANSRTSNTTDIPVRNTRGMKRKADIDSNKNETTTTTTTTTTISEANPKIIEQKENADSKLSNEEIQKENETKDESQLTSLASSDVMGKGKRARIPNKRYSDIILTSNRKSGVQQKPSDAVESELNLKDLPAAEIEAPSSKRTRAILPKENLQDPKYLKPFKYGWRRELVWRSTNSPNSKRIGDIYYYNPNGKKVRSIRELGENLPANKTLTLDNFSFNKEPLGIDDPEKEMIRDAKFTKFSDDRSSPVSQVIQESTDTSTSKKVETRKPKKKIKNEDTIKTEPEPVTSRVKRKTTASPTANIPEEKKEPVKETFKKRMSLRGKQSQSKKPKIESKNEESTETSPATSPRAIQIKTRGQRSRVRKANLNLKSITNNNSQGSEEIAGSKLMENYMQMLSYGYNTLLHVFQYLKVQDLLRAGCVCTMWRDIASLPSLWRTVRMKNSQVHSFEGLANALKKHGTVNLDLRKMLLPNNGEDIWPQFSKAICIVDTLKKIELCRCPASVVEQLCTSNPDLEVINAVTIKCERLNLDQFRSLKHIKELRLKSTSGLHIESIDSLKELKTLSILSLTSVNQLNKLNLHVIAELTDLESLDLGECSDFPNNFGKDILLKLTKLEKLRLEKGQGECHTFEILDAVKSMKRLEQLELVNFDVKTGFDKAIGACVNIKKLLIIPTYISQSATTNNMVLSGVLRLQGTLSHFVWGVTLELLRVTELFVDQCDDSNKKEKKPTGNGDSIPVLKPVPDLSNGGTIQAASNPPQVEILPLPNLQKMLLNSLPTTRVKILKIPFHATWRQTLTDSV